MQLGLRFAAAKLPGLRTDREGAATSWSQAGTLMAREADRELGGLLSPAGRFTVQ